MKIVQTLFTKKIGFTTILYFKIGSDWTDLQFLGHCILEGRILLFLPLVYSIFLIILVCISNQNKFIKTRNLVL